MYGKEILRNALDRYRLRKALLAVQKFPLTTMKHAHGLPNELVISLTSYPRRFSTLAMTIKGLLDQNVHADRVVLWLGYGDAEKLPPDVVALEAWGLEVRETADIGPHTKLIPSLVHFPDAFIATADDDVYYPPDWLMALVRCCRANTLKHIVAWRAHLASRNPNGTLISYYKWSFETRKLRSPDREHPLFPTGIGGILYPPHALAPMVTDTEAFEELCKHNDDIWFFWMAALARTPTVRVARPFKQTIWPFTQDSGLVHENVNNGRNDIQIRAMEMRYGTYKFFGT